MSLEKIRQIKRLDNLEANPIQDLAIQRLNAQMNAGVGSANFEALMQRVEQSSATKVTTDNTIEKNMAARPTVMEEVSKLGNTIGSRRENFSANKVIESTKDAAKMVAQVSDTLQRNAGEVRSSAQSFLRSRLDNVDQNLQVALSKVGEEYVADPSQFQGLKPVEKFIGMLTNSQAALTTLGQRMQEMSDQGTALSPAAMLAVQIKVHTVTREIEFFSSLLSKAIESAKTVMNVQV